MTENKPNNKKGKIRITIGLLLLAVGICLICSSLVTSFFVQSMTDSKLSEVHLTPSNLKKLKEKADVSKKENSTYNYSEIKNVSLKDVLAAQMEDKGVTPIGVLVSDKINLRLPILEGVTNYNMLVGAGTMKPKQKLGVGNYSLASHNMNNDKTLFSPIHKLKKNDALIVTDYSKIYVYSVVENKIVNPTEVQVVDNVKGKKLLTLVTCTTDGKKRIIVQGELRKVENLNKKNSVIFQ